MRAGGDEAIANTVHMRGLVMASSDNDENRKPAQERREANLVSDVGRGRQHCCIPGGGRRRDQNRPGREDGGRHEGVREMREPTTTNGTGQSSRTTLYQSRINWDHDRLLSTVEVPVYLRGRGENEGDCHDPNCALLSRRTVCPASLRGISQGGIPPLRSPRDTDVPPAAVELRGVHYIIGDARARTLLGR